MTTQATPDFNTMLADQRKATETAQAIADDYRRQLDAARDAMVGLMRANVLLNRDIRTLSDELITLRTDRDLLMSELGEANQGLMVGEGL